MRRDECRLCVVVVNFGTASLLPALIAPLESLSWVSVVVVDNWSNSEERARVKAIRSDPRVAVLECEDNAGFGAGCNRGAEFALERGATHLLFLNPDARIAPDALEALLEAVDGAQQPVLASPTVLDAQGRTWFRGGMLDRRMGIACHASSGEALVWITGACLATDARSWNQLGGFDESYFLYWEDVDLSSRCSSLGGELIVVPETARHLVGGSQDGSGKSSVYLACSLQNRIRYARLNIGWFCALLWWLATPVYLLQLARVSGVRSGRTPLRVFIDGVARGIVLATAQLVAGSRPPRRSMDARS